MKYNIYSKRTDVKGSAQQLCTNLDEDTALSMLTYYKQTHEGHTLHTPTGDVPYNSVMRWYMLPTDQSPTTDPIGRLIPAKGVRRVR